jgi:hypothetical protein
MLSYRILPSVLCAMFYVFLSQSLLGRHPSRVCESQRGSELAHLYAHRLVGDPYRAAREERDGVQVEVAVPQ